MSAPNPLLAHLLSAPPFIPELHTDDCDDTSCVRCRTTTDWAAAADQLTALKAKRLAAGLAAEYRHLTDTRDAAFAALACTHPEACSSDADYPAWTPGGTR
ncbi:hypothetical protein ABZ622_39345 [Streptomyces sp. NPDC007164]|uniref:hypothetical protein n=1 Tax=Streptomyces sp. NPDC007164 TaxID=3156918 RepID=UPI0033D39B85